MQIQLSDHFTYRRVFRFVLPSVVMMIFTSIYSVVDGIFVSNFVGKTSFAAVNLVMPVLMLASSLGFMIGTGGSALVAMLLGRGEAERANGVFSLLVYTCIALGVVITGAVFLSMEKIVALFGAEGQLAQDAAFYGRIVITVCFVFMLQNTFQSFLIVAERPTMGLVLTVSAGVTNIVLDALFVAVFRWGLFGAAFATCISQLIGGGIPLAYFLLPNKSPLRLGKPVLSLTSLLKTCANGSSELVTNIAMSIVSILYNHQLLKLAGEDGVASYGALMYVSFIFVALFLGYGIGSAPIVSYHYGAQNTAELQNLFRKDCTVIALSGAALFAFSELLAYPLAHLFTGYDSALFAMTRRAFLLYSFSYLFAGFNIIGSSFFTALNNGFVSALISFLRTLVFQIAAVLVLPLMFGLDGIWLSGCTTEVLSLLVTISCVLICRKRYAYF